MSVSRISTRYAKALIDLAQEQNKLEAVYQDVLSLKEVLKNREFDLLMKSPIIKPDAKNKVFKAIFETKFNELTSAFCKIVINKSREAYLFTIANSFISQYRQIKDISTVKLVTAVPVGEATVEAIKEKLTGSSLLNKNIEMETAIDETILGGFVLEFDDKLYDASLARELEQLKKEFSKNTYIKTL